MECTYKSAGTYYSSTQNIQKVTIKSQKVYIDHSEQIFGQIITGHFDQAPDKLYDKRGGFVLNCE